MKNFSQKIKEIIAEPIFNFIVSDEKFNISFLLKNTVQLIFIVSIIALVKMILIKSGNPDERLIAGYIYVFLGGIFCLGAIQTLFVFFNSSKDKFLSIFFTTYFILMIIGIYVVQLITNIK